MFGGAPILAIPWAYVQHDAARRHVEYPFGVIQRNEASLAGFRNYPYAAVVYGYQTPAGHAQSGTWWRHDSRLASLGAFAALLYGHMLDDPAALAQYKVLYLADFTHVSEGRAANIRRFVEQGGDLVASYATSLFDHPATQFGRRSRTSPPPP